MTWENKLIFPPQAKRGVGGETVKTSGIASGLEELGVGQKRNSVRVEAGRWVKSGLFKTGKMVACLKVEMVVCLKTFVYVESRIRCLRTICTQKRMS